MEEPREGCKSFASIFCQGGCKVKTIQVSAVREFCVVNHGKRNTTEKSHNENHICNA